MAGPPPPHFPGPFNMMGDMGDTEMRGPPRPPFPPDGPRPPPLSMRGPPEGRPEGWAGPESRMEGPPDWNGGPASPPEGPEGFRMPGGMGMPLPPGQPGMEPPFREGQSRGEFGGRGGGPPRGEFGRPEGRSGGDFGGRGGFEGGRRGNFGGHGRWGGGDGDFHGGRGRGFPDMSRGEGGPPRGRGLPFRGRGDRGRGDFGRFGGRQGFEGRGRRGEEGRPFLPDVDPTLLERRRASTASLLRQQVSQLQVSKDLLGKEDSWQTYSKIMERAQQEHQPGDVRELYTYPIFAVEEAGTGPLASVPDAADEMQAFEQCLQLYQEAQAGCTVMQSERGNFLLPITPT